MFGVGWLWNSQIVLHSLACFMASVLLVIMGWTLMKFHNRRLQIERFSLSFWHSFFKKHMVFSVGSWEFRVRWIKKTCWRQQKTPSGNLWDHWSSHIWGVHSSFWIRKWTTRFLCLSYLSSGCQLCSLLLSHHWQRGWLRYFRVFFTKDSSI